MKKYSLVLVILLLLCLIGTTSRTVIASEEFAGGRGTEVNPYLVETAEHLDNVRNYLDSYFKQIDNIDLSGYDNWIPIGDEDNPFIGSYDGGGKDISDLSINREADDYVGLFGYIHGGILENIKLEIENVTGYEYVGSLIGYQKGGEILYCSFRGNKVEGREYVGGLVGYNTGNIKGSYAKGDVAGLSILGGFVGNNYFSGNIENCYAEGDVNGRGSDIGGFVGQNFMGDIKNSYAEGDVNGERIRIGGFVGVNMTFGNIENCYAEGNIIGGHRYIGGFVGANYEEIKASYAKGDVAGQSRTGGFVGENYSGEIINNYALGSVEGDKNVGGFVGINYDDIINNYALGNVKGNECVGGFVGKNEARIKYGYAVGEVTSHNYAGGFAGDNDDGAIGYSYYDKDTTGQDDEGKGEPKTTKEMIQQNAFEPEWDFDNIWSIDEGSSYPYFQWQNDNIPYLTE